MHHPFIVGNPGTPLTSFSLSRRFRGGSLIAWVRSLLKVPVARSIAVGIDIGPDTLTAVLLRLDRNGNTVMTHCARHVCKDFAGDGDVLGRQFQALLRDLGASAKDCAVSVSRAGSFLRVVEQPVAPTGVLRELLLVEGEKLLNQSVENYVLDCGPLPLEYRAASEGPSASRRKYLVGGVLRAEIQRISEACRRAKLRLRRIQPTPICVFSALRLACPEEDFSKGFLLVDIGPDATTVIGGVRGEFSFARSINFGSAGLMATLFGLCGLDAEGILGALERKDEVIAGYVHAAICSLGNEIFSSIAFLENSHDAIVHRVFLSGGPAETSAFRALLEEQVAIPIECWRGLDRCIIALPAGQRRDIEHALPEFNPACCAALQVLDPRDSPGFNFLHELETSRKIRKCDPLRLSATAICAMALGFAGDYLYETRNLRNLQAESARLRAEYPRLKVMAEAARKRGEELDATSKLSNALVKRVEGRFYWAPILGTISRCAPPEIQLTRLSGYLNYDAGKMCRIKLDGIASGDQPRETAEKLRQAINTELSPRFFYTSVTFTSLIDSERTVEIDGKRKPCVEFYMAILLKQGNELGTNPQASQVRTARSVNRPKQP